MDTINGNSFADYGFVIMSIQGILDLPKRKGATFYDWGNGYEPLVDEDDIYFHSREITIEVLFDSRKSSDFEASVESFKLDNAGEVDLVTEYGTNTVRIHEVKVTKNFKGGSKTAKITLLEQQPDLSGGIPTVQGTSSVRVDGYDIFARFGFLVEDVVLFNVPELKESPETRNKSNVISVYREPQEIEVKINGIYSNKTEMSTKIKEFNALLAKSGLRHFVYQSYGFQCLVDEGVTVKIYRQRVTLTLKLKVMAYYNYEEIVQEVVNRVNIQANPQSDLAVTDPGDPAFIKNKDTFKAADSFKLAGQDETFYAKEQEIADLRSTDLAADLETLTPNI